VEGVELASSAADTTSTGIRIESITTASAAWRASTSFPAQRFSNATRRAELLGARSSLTSSASSGPNAPGCVTSIERKAAPSSSMYAALSDVTTPSASFMTKSRSSTRIVPLSTRSMIAGAMRPVNLLPGKPMMETSTGPTAMTAPCRVALQLETWSNGSPRP
jgi:hypothetical protein